MPDAGCCHHTGCFAFNLDATRKSSELRTRNGRWKPILTKEAMWRSFARSRRPTKLFSKQCLHSLQKQRPRVSPKAQIHSLPPSPGLSLMPLGQLPPQQRLPLRLRPEYQSLLESRESRGDGPWKNPSRWHLPTSPDMPGRIGCQKLRLLSPKPNQCCNHQSQSLGQQRRQRKQKDLRDPNLQSPKSQIILLRNYGVDCCS